MATGGDRFLVLKLAGFAAGMFAFGFLLVPLYDVFCDITGLGGRTADTAAEAPPAMVESERVVTVEFVTTVNQQAPWEFEPAIASMPVRVGQLYDATFVAHNLSDRRITGQAVPSVAPGLAAKHFKKTECFCFDSQDYAPAEQLELPLRFVVDSALPAHIDRLTLSYTMFEITQVAAAAR